MGSFEYGMLVEQLATTATAAGTTTLVNTSLQNQVFTGSSSQTVVLPSATTMSVGQHFHINNQSSGFLTLQFNGATAFTDASGKAYANIPPGTSLTVMLQTNSTSAGTWAVYAPMTVAGLTVPVYAQGTVTTSTTINWPNSNVFTMTLTSGDTCTVTFTNPSSGQAIVVEVTNGASGGTGVVTWPTVKWAGGTAPTMTTGTAALDVYTFVYNGSYYVGSVVQNMS
jgi:hypothetical protein